MSEGRQRNQTNLPIAVVGSGVAGLSAAWLLAKQGYQVQIFESDDRPGGHSNTVTTALPGGTTVEVDTGFIVYNEATYPNLMALFDYLDVETTETDMSFAVSNARGVEYAGRGLRGVFAQKRNLFRPGFWQMLLDIRRFYLKVTDLDISASESLNDVLAREDYSDAFIHDHILPMAAAIWSTEADDVGGMQAMAFVKFFSNHGLLQFRDRPMWRTVVGGSRQYVKKLLAEPGIQLELGARIQHIKRKNGLVEITDAGGTRQFSDVVMATHADTTRELLTDPTPKETETLSHFDYTTSRAYLHTDAGLMPRTRAAWASWNYIELYDRLCVTYWMNSLQPLGTDEPVFLTLNPEREPDIILAEFEYSHPLLNRDTAHHRQSLWHLQGNQSTWFCGAYFGDGFHEDGLQSGLAVAEAISGRSRPWDVPDPNSRIVVIPDLVRAA